MVGVFDRKTGRVHLYIPKPDKEGKTLTGGKMLNIIENPCKEGTIVITDDFKSYNILNGADSGYIHLSVNHSLGEYCNYKDKSLHTNNMKNFWSV